MLGTRTPPSSQPGPPTVNGQGAERRPGLRSSPARASPGRSEHSPSNPVSRRRAGLGPARAQGARQTALQPTSPHVTRAVQTGRLPGARRGRRAQPRGSLQRRGRGRPVCSQTRHWPLWAARTAVSHLLPHPLPSTAFSGCGAGGGAGGRAGRADRLKVGTQTGRRQGA